IADHPAVDLGNQHVPVGRDACEPVAALRDRAPRQLQRIGLNSGLIKELVDRLGIRELGGADPDLRHWLSAQSCATGPWRWPSGAAWRMASVMKCLAVATAARRGAPLASSAAMAAEKVQPVPCVFGVAKRSEANSSKVWPS